MNEDVDSELGTFIACSCGTLNISAVTGYTAYSEES